MPVRPKGKKKNKKTTTTTIVLETLGKKAKYKMLKNIKQ